MHIFPNNPYKQIFLFFLFFSCCILCIAQETKISLDTSISLGTSKKTSLIKSKSNNKKSLSDTLIKVDRRPGIASIRSAILPGLGQIYNKKYWKLPIIYGALGTAAVVFIFNHKNYKDLKLAYRGKYNVRVYHDSTDYKKIKPDLLPLSEESLRFNRDQFRRNVDYSVLFFAILWGLNVMDAAVDAHLKSFDISPDLSLQIKTGYSEMANTNGVSLVMRIGK